MKTFPTLNAIKTWAKTNDVKYMDVQMPYVQKDENFYYFGLNNSSYILLMISSKDLQA